MVKEDIKTFKIKEVNKDVIVCEDVKQIKELYNTIQKDENFILDSGKRSMLIIGATISSKVINGEVSIVSKK